MPDYNLGTASGKIEINGRGAQLGFKVAQTAAGAFFTVVKSRVEDVQKLGRRVAAVGAAGTAGFGLAVKTASAFEQSMSGVYAVANANETQMEALRKKALQLGKDTQYSASEASQALEEILKAGVSVKDALGGAADATVALAAAGGLDLPQAATIAANAMNAFEISAKDMPQIADVLAGVANTSAADVSEIGESFSQASAVAHLAGLSFRDTAIAIGEMADMGIKGSDAGTSLKTMLNNLQPTTDKQSGKFEELGITTYNLANANKALRKEGLKQVTTVDAARKSLGKYLAEQDKGNEGTVRNKVAVSELLQKYGGMHNAFFDAKGDVKDLGGLQEVLAHALKGQTKQQKLANLETLFGADAMRASAIMSLAGKKGYEDFSAAVAKTKAADVAKTRMDNLAGSVEQFKGSLETVQIVIGSVAIPVLNALTKAATWVLNLFLSLPDGVQKTIAIMIAVGSAIMLVVGTLIAIAPLLLVAIGHFLLMRSIGTVTKGFFAFFKALRGGQSVMAATRVAALTTGREMNTLGKRTIFAGKMSFIAAKFFRGLWIAITGPIGIAIAVIAGLVLLGIILYKKWKPFRDLVDKIAAVLREKLMAAWKQLLPYVILVRAALQKFGNYLKSVVVPILQNVGKIILQKLISAFIIVRNVVLNTILPALIRFGGYIKSTMTPVLAQIGKMLRGKLVKGFLEIKASVLKSLLPAIQKLVDAFQNNIVPATTSLWAKIQPLIAAFFRFAGVIGDKLLPVIVKIGQIFVQYVLPILAKVVGFLLGVVIGAVVDIVKGFIQAVTGIVQIFTGLINFFTGLFTGDWKKMWGGLLTIMLGLLNLIVGALKVWMNIGLLKIVGLGFKAILAIVKGSWRGIFAIFKGAGKGIWAATKAIFRTLFRIITFPFRLYIAIIRGAWRLITRIFTDAGPRLVSTVRTVFPRILTFIRNAMTMARNFISNVWATIQLRFYNGLHRLVWLVRTIFSTIVQYFRNLPGRFLRGLGNIKNFLVQAGRDLISGLFRGIRSMIPDIAGAMGAVGDKIKGFLPGSPIAEGPLVVWNRGKVGKRLISMLAEGMKDTRPIDDSMKAVAGYINGMQSMVKPLDLTSVVSAVPANLAVSATHAITSGGTAPKAKATAAGTTKVLNQTNNIHNPKPEKAGKSQAKMMRDKVEEAGW